jgi:UrcA family protein
MKSPANKQAVFFAGMFSISMMALAWAPLVHGASPEEAPSRHVSYADLNIDSASGAEALYVRIRYAARAVCSQYESEQLDRRSVWQSCVSKSVDAAVAKINNRMLSSIHNGSNAKSPVG